MESESENRHSEDGKNSPTWPVPALLQEAELSAKRAHWPALFYTAHKNQLRMD